METPRLLCRSIDINNFPTCATPLSGPVSVSRELVGAAPCFKGKTSFRNQKSFSSLQADGVKRNFKTMIGQNSKTTHFKYPKRMCTVFAGPKSSQSGCRDSRRISQGELGDGIMCKPMLGKSTVCHQKPTLRGQVLPGEGVAKLFPKTPNAAPLKQVCFPTFSFSKDLEASAKPEEIFSTTPKPMPASWGCLPILSAGVLESVGEREKIFSFTPKQSLKKRASFSSMSMSGVLETPGPAMSGVLETPAPADHDTITFPTSQKSSFPSFSFPKLEMVNSMETQAKQEEVPISPVRKTLEYLSFGAPARKLQFLNIEHLTPFPRSGVHA